MRIVLLGASAILLGACATVSMTPGERSMTTEASATQTALRSASEAYCKTTEEEGWVARSGNLFGLARILIHGDKSDAHADDPDYAIQIGAGEAEASIVFAQITGDAIAARTGLAGVAKEARALLSADETTVASRADVMSFERALVSAQKSYRAFAKATDIAVQASEAAPAELDAALSGLTEEIDAARATADRLAARYASLTSHIS